MCGCQLKNSVYRNTSGPDDIFKITIFLFWHARIAHIFISRTGGRLRTFDLT